MRSSTTARPTRAQPTRTAPSPISHVEIDKMMPRVPNWRAFAATYGGIYTDDART
ncbi:hypothetical protein [Nocardioides sp. AN3]